MWAATKERVGRRLGAPPGERRFSLCCPVAHMAPIRDVQTVFELLRTNRKHCAPSMFAALTVLPSCPQGPHQTLSDDFQNFSEKKNRKNQKISEK